MQIDHKQLIHKAIDAMSRAYAPYSHYRVGAALLAASGKIYTGCNVENSVYSETICAERTAVVKAVSDGERDFIAIAVATLDGGSPCGACRQVLNEFSPGMTVILANEKGELQEPGGIFTAADLLPHRFGPDNLAAD
ncbi:MAG: cytidine deaminase [Anaerolineales bacterium]|nr:cytidine deaminase [Anaerolineales bacterium]